MSIQFDRWLVQQQISQVADSYALRNLNKKGSENLKWWRTKTVVNVMGVVGRCLSKVLINPVRSDESVGMTMELLITIHMGFICPFDRLYIRLITDVQS